MRPVLRLVCAVTLLSAYYSSLFPGALFGDVASVTATAITSTGSDIRRDIEASEVAYAAGRYADALEPTVRLTEQMPSQAPYLDRLAHIYRELGNRREEARSLERMFAVSPTPGDACPRLGQAYEAAGDVSAALNAFERCVDVDPENPDALLLLGRAYQVGGRAADARRVLEKALAVSPRYADVHLLLGIRYYADGHVDVARQHFERFLELSPARRDEVSIWLERTKATAR